MLRWLRRLLILAIVLGIAAVAVVAGLLAFGPDDFQGTLERRLDVDLGWLPEPLRDETTTTTTPTPTPTPAPAAPEGTVTNRVPEIADACSEFVTTAVARDLEVTVFASTYAVPFEVTVEPNVGTLDGDIGLCFAANAGDVILVTEIQEGDIVGRAGTGVDIYVTEPSEVYFVDAAGARIGDAPARQCDGAGENCEGFGLNFRGADSEFVSADDEWVYAQIQSAGVIDYAIVPFADAFVVIFPFSETGVSGTFTYDVRARLMPPTEG